MFVRTSSLYIAALGSTTHITLCASNITSSSGTGSGSTTDSAALTRAAKCVRYESVSSLHGSASLREKMLSRNQLQRILRRMPLGTNTRSILYFNELPSNIKVDLVKLSLQMMREAEEASVREGRTKRKDNVKDRGEEKERTSESIKRPGIAQLVTLHSPRLGISTLAHKMLRGRHRHRMSAATHEDQMMLPDMNAASCIDEGTAAVLLLPDLESQYTSLGLCTSARLSSPFRTAHSVFPAAAAITSGVQVCTSNTAWRVDCTPIPHIYIIGIPQSLLLPGTDLAHMLRRLLVFDETSRQLLLLSPSTAHHDDVDSDGDGATRPISEGCVEQNGIFLLQTYFFNASEALAAAAACPHHRLFYLCSSMAEPKARGPLQHASAYFPAFFTGHSVVLRSSNAGERTAATLAARNGEGDDGGEQRLSLPMKRLRVVNTSHTATATSAEDDGSGSHHQPHKSSSPPRHHLWSSQVDTVTDTTATSSSSRHMPTMGFYTRSMGVKDKASGQGGILLQSDPLKAAERSLLKYKEGLLVSSIMLSSTPPPDSPPHLGDITFTNHHSKSHSEATLRHAYASYMVLEVSSVMGQAEGCTGALSSQPLPSCLTHEATGGATSLAQQLWQALHPSQETVPFLTCAYDDLMYARERVLLPFLRNPRVGSLLLPTQGRKKHAGACDAGSRDLSGVVPDVPVLWTRADLEAESGWRRHRDFFELRYGPIENLLSLDLFVDLGSKHAGEGEDDMFLLFYDEAFVKQVMLPAMCAYVRATTQKATISFSSSYSSSPPDECKEDVLAAEVAVRHRERMAGWIEDFRSAPETDRQEWLRRGTFVGSGEGGHRMRCPLVNRRFFHLLLASETALRKATTAVVPIADLLSWVTFSSSSDVLSPNCLDHGTRACGAGENVLSTADRLKFLKYLATFPQYFVLAGGEGMTVGFMMA